MIPEELEREIDGRSGWKVVGRFAVYDSGTHVVRVLKLDKPFKRDEPWWTGLSVDGAAKWVATHYSAEIAVKWAEQVRLTG